MFINRSARSSFKNDSFENLSCCCCCCIANFFNKLSKIKSYNRKMSSLVI